MAEGQGRAGGLARRTRGAHPARCRWSACLLRATGTLGSAAGSRLARRRVDPRTGKTARRRSQGPAESGSGPHGCIGPSLSPPACGCGFAEGRKRPASEPFSEGTGAARNRAVLTRPGARPVYPSLRRRAVPVHRRTSPPWDERSRSARAASAPPPTFLRQGPGGDPPRGGASSVRSPAGGGSSQLVGCHLPQARLVLADVALHVDLVHQEREAARVPSAWIEGECLPIQDDAPSRGVSEEPLEALPVGPVDSLPTDALLSDQGSG